MSREHKWQDAIWRYGDVGLFAFLSLVVVVSTLAVHHMQQRVLVADEARFAVQALHAVRDRPLVGDFTTVNVFGGPVVRQPGPAAIWFAYPFVRLLGIDLGGQVAALAVNVGSIATATWAVRRVAGRIAGVVTFGMFWLAGLLAMPGLMASLLNPNLVALPMLCVCVLSWVLARGDTAVAPALMFGLSFVAQVHVGYSVVAGSAALAGIVVTILHRRSWPDRWPVHLGSSVVVVAMAWALPMWDQVFRTGNLGLMVTARFPGRGVDGAWGVTGALLNFPPRALAGPFTEADFVGPDLTAVFVVVALVALLWRRRRRLGRSPEAFVAVGALAGALLTGYLTPPLDVANYEFRWVWATLLFGAFTLIFLRPGDERKPKDPIRARLGWVFCWSAVLLIVGQVVLTHPTSERREMDATRELTGEIRVAQDMLAPVAVVTRGGNSVAAVGNATVAHLDAEGLPVSNGAARDGARQMAMTQGAADQRSTGPVIARWRPAPDGAPAPLLPDELIPWLRERASEIRLTPSGRQDLAVYVDGAVPFLCLNDLRSDQARLLDLPVAVIASLYQNSQVATPLLPPDLFGAVGAWADRLPITVRDVASRGDGDLIISQSNC